MQKEMDELTKANKALLASVEMKEQKLKEKEEEISALVASNTALSSRLQVH